MFTFFIHVDFYCVNGYVYATVKDKSVQNWRWWLEVLSFSTVTLALLFIGTYYKNCTQTGYFM